MNVPRPLPQQSLANRASSVTAAMPLLPEIPELLLETRIRYQNDDVIACLHPVDSTASLPILVMKRHPDVDKPDKLYNKWRFVHKELDARVYNEESKVWCQTALEIYSRNFRVIWTDLRHTRMTRGVDESNSCFAICHDRGYSSDENPVLQVYRDQHREFSAFGPNDGGLLVSGDLIALGRSLDSSDAIYTYAFRQLTQDSLIDLQHAIHKKYDFVRLLGRGAYGSVFLALHRDSGERVAIKVQEALSPSRLARVKNEFIALDNIEDLRARTQGASGAQHLCAFKDKDQAGDYYYAVFEFAAGGDLAGKLDPRNPMSEDQAKVYIMMMLRGLSIIHSEGLVHRDLKPSNVVIAFDEHANEVAKLADFGFTKQVNAGEQLQTDCGTGVYVAPEVRLYGGGQDCRGDLYAVGVSIFALLIGREDCGFNQDTTLLGCCEECFSPECRDLIKGLTAYEETRISIKEAIAHPWFSVPSPPLTCRPDPRGCPHNRDNTPTSIARRYSGPNFSPVVEVSHSGKSRNRPASQHCNHVTGLPPIAEEAASNTSEMDDPSGCSRVLSRDEGDRLMEEQRRKRLRSRSNRSLPSGTTVPVRSKSRALSKTRRFDKTDTAHRANTDAMDEGSEAEDEAEPEVEAGLRLISGSSSHVLY